MTNEDYEWLSNYRWRVNQGGYATCFYRENGKTVSKRMHRMIANPSAEEEVDHINHNKLDNQRHNLRNCTKSQNNMNRKSNSGNKLLKHSTKGLLRFMVKIINI